ncbi:hypothetical protein SLA2020_196960 [Shorea laevis]
MKPIKQLQSRGTELEACWVLKGLHVEVRTAICRGHLAPRNCVNGSGKQYGPELYQHRLTSPLTPNLIFELFCTAVWNDG